MAPRKYSPVECPKCKGFNTISRGWFYNGRKKNYCKDCKRNIIGEFNSDKVRPYPQSKSRPREVKKVKQKSLAKPVINPLCSSCGKSVCICEQLAEEKERLKIALNLDSVINVPCFLCQERNIECVLFCPDFEEFVLGEL